MNKSLAICFSASTPEEYPFTDPLTGVSYQLLATLAENKSVDLRFVLGEENIRNTTFTSYWKFEGEKFTHFIDEFTPSLVYLQTRDYEVPEMKRINNTLLESICLDKYKTYEVFKSLTKKTLLVNEHTSVSSLNTELVVVKPRFGSLGYKIHVLPKIDFNPKDFKDEQYIVQEFIDSSKGIQGLVNERHELRAYIFNGNMKAAYLRIPREGSYIANIGQGAHEMQFELDAIQSSMSELIKNVDTQFSDVNPRLYTIDVMFEDDRPWIVELNDMPGMPDVSVQPLTTDYFNAMLGLLTES